MILGAIKISIAEAVLLAGVAGVALRELADLRGWTRSSRLLRKENEDLVRVNEQYAQKILTNEETILRQGDMIKVLEGRVEELSKRDQEAVLNMLQTHEINAQRRHTERTDAEKQRHQEFLDVISEVRGALLQLASKEAA